MYKPIFAIVDSSARIESTFNTEEEALECYQRADSSSLLVMIPLKVLWKKDENRMNLYLGDRE